MSSSSAEDGAKCRYGARGSPSWQHARTGKCGIATLPALPAGSYDDRLRPHGRPDWGGAGLGRRHSTRSAPGCYRRAGMGCMGYALSNTLCPEPHENAHCRIKTSSITTDDSGLSLAVRPRDGTTWQAEARTTCAGMCTGTELCSKLASTLTASAETREDKWNHTSLGNKQIRNENENREIKELRFFFECRVLN